MSIAKLVPVPVTDTGVLEQCKQTLNKWSNSLPFTVTKNLGDAVQLVSATMYHAYSFTVGTDFVKRKFDLQKGGSPVSSPTDIHDLTLWDISGVEDSGDFDFAIKETCYKETCEECGGQGKMTCDQCGGSRKVTCDKCDGAGVTKCHHCWGKGTEACSPNDWRHGDGTNIDGKGKRCPKCHGTGVVTCSKCHGSGEVRCSKCKGTREITCPKCDGKGVLVCKSCDGRGWNSFTWHLIQNQDDDKLELMFYDEGIAEKPESGKCRKYTANTLFTKTAKADQVAVDGIDTECAAFATELHEKWQETFAKFDDVEDLRVLKQQVDFVQYDAAIRYEYTYNSKTYLIWIDLAKKKVFEGPEGGLMAEWAGKVAKEGDKFAGKDPQRAIRSYAMACAISKVNKDPAKKIRNQLAIGSWLFRLATAGVGGWLWSVFMGSQGADPVTGWYVAGAIVVLDFLFARKGLWMSFVAAACVYGFIIYLFPELMPPDVAAKAGEVKRLLPVEITSNAALREYMIYSILIWIGVTLLFARDLALRTRGGVLVFPILGALVGAACAPAGYLDFAKDPACLLQIMQYVAYGICGLAVLRTLSRAFIQNCGRNAQKFPNFMIRLEAKMLNPVFWLMPVYAVIFAGVGVLWYFYAGPGVSIEEKANAAERFLQSKQANARGKYYLEQTANDGYAPSVSRLAELKLTGSCGYAAAPEEAYAIAVKAAGMNDARGCRLQGFCMEFGKGVAQNLTEANACYAKGAGLGDAESVRAKARTDAIAKVWNAAHANDKSAQYALALHYAEGDGIAKDEAVARKWMLKSADAGFVKAQMTVCDWLIKGFGGAKKPELGVGYCEKAAQQGDPEAIAGLGYYYFEGKLIKQNYAKAIEGFTRACEKGSESAPYMLGHCYQNGLGVAKDDKKAFEFYKLSYDRGSLPGAFACGECYENASGVDVDYTSALACYTKSAGKKWEAPLLKKGTADAKRAEARIAKIGKSWKPANAGDAAAMDIVGQCFAVGEGVAKDAAKAYAWYVKAAAKDNVSGMIHKADALFNGVGVKQDKDAAGKTYELAAGKGDAYGLYMLGLCHENGNGVEKNLTSAYNRYCEALKKGYAKADAPAKRIVQPAKYWDAAFKKKDAEAQYNLALCYKKGGCGVDKNDGEAFKLFRMSADQGNAAALFEVSKCYAVGCGTKKDDAAMSKAALASAEKMFPAALFFAGELYQVGRSVDQNLTTAYDYFTKAAKANFPGAEARAKMIANIAKYWDSAIKGKAVDQYNLGVCYRDGVEIAKDAAKARGWFEKAVKQGEHDAEYALAAMIFASAKEDETVVAKDVVPLLKKAVAAQQVEAKVLMGRLLYQGLGIEEDYEQAIKLWEEAIKAKDLEANYWLADYYYTGHGIFNSGKDQEKAKKMWAAASDAGDVLSSLKLGTLYGEGEGMFGGGQDMEQAKKYLGRAIDKGSHEAMLKLGTLLADSDSASEKKEGEDWIKKSKVIEKVINPNLKWYSIFKTLE